MNTKHAWIRMALALPFISWVALSAPTAAASYGDHFTDAKPPVGLGTLKFDMTPTQVKKLCQGGWAAIELAEFTRESEPYDAGYECHRMPMKVGFEDFEMNLYFVNNRLVVISLVKEARSSVKPEFDHVHQSLIRKYGSIPGDRRDDEYESYEWSFRPTGNPKTASDVVVARHTFPGRKTLHVRYRSHRYRRELGKFYERQRQESEGAF